MMFERLSRIEPNRGSESRQNTEALQTLLKPGMLVWGGTFRKEEMPQFLAKGICPAILTGRPLTFVPDSVCLSMLPDYPQAPLNYFSTNHRGPKEITRRPQAGFLRVGVVVDPHVLINAFPQARAIGADFFTHNDLYGGAKDNAYGIPLTQWYLLSKVQGWASEVRVPFRAEAQAGITPDLWEGLIIGSRQECCLPMKCLDKPIVLPSGEVIS